MGTAQITLEPPPPRAPWSSFLEPYFLYRVSQKKVYNKMCVLFAGFVKGVEENCLSQTGEVSLHPLTLEIALGQSLRPRGATLPSPACDLQFSSTPLTKPANNIHILLHTFLWDTL